MKKGILLLIAFTFLFSACTEQENTENQSDETDTKTEQEESVESTNTNEETEEDEKDSDSEESSEDETATTENSTCAKSTPVGGYFKVGYSVQVCGEDTKYQAYPFEDYGFYLYVVEDIDSKKYEVKTVSTTKPHTPKTLFEGYGSTPNLQYVEAEDKIIDEHFITWLNGDAPGSLRQVFIFNPETKDFLLAEDSFWNAIQSLHIYSSNISSPFIAELNTEDWMGGEDYTITNDEIKMTVNNQTFTKKVVLEGKADKYKDIFECQILSIDTNNLDSVVKEYIANFPNKVNCYENGWNPNSPKIGHIDLTTNEYKGE